MGILNFLATSSFLTINKVLIKELGIEASILLSELASELDYWEKQEGLENGYFYSTVENIEEKTTLTKYQQKKAFETLKEMDLIDVKLKGMPAKRYIKINEIVVVKKLNNQLDSFLTSCSKKTEQQVVKKLNRNNNIYNNNINNNNILNNNINNISNNINNNINKKENITKEKIDYDEFKDIYNLYCSKLSECKTLSDNRKRAIKRFLKDYNLDDFKEICKITNESEFLTGKNNRGWKANIDFILRVDKAEGILENKYNNKKSNSFNDWQTLFDEAKESL